MLIYRVRLTICLDALRDGIRPLCVQEWKKFYGEGWLLKVNKKFRQPQDKPNVDDLAFLLHGLKATWDDIWKHKFEPRVKSLIFVASDVRNDWAHNKPFSTGDISSSMRTIERILRAFSIYDPNARQYQHIVEKQLNDHLEQGREKGKTDSPPSTQSASPPKPPKSPPPVSQMATNSDGEEPPDKPPRKVFSKGDRFQFLPGRSWIPSKHTGNLHIFLGGSGPTIATTPWNPDEEQECVKVDIIAVLHKKEPVRVYTDQNIFPVVLRDLICLDNEALGNLKKEDPDEERSPWILEPPTDEEVDRANEWVDENVSFSNGRWVLKNHPNQKPPPPPQPIGKKPPPRPKSPPPRGNLRVVGDDTGDHYDPGSEDWDERPGGRATGNRYDF